MGGGGFGSVIITSRETSNLFYVRTDVSDAFRWDNAAGKWASLLEPAGMYFLSVYLAATGDKLATIKFLKLLMCADGS